MAKLIVKGEVDNKTVDLVPVEPDPEPKKRGRGRPPTGKAMSDKERQAARRLRLKEAGLQAVTVVLPVGAVVGLKNFVKFKPITPSSVVAKLITCELLRKR